MSTEKPDVRLKIPEKEVGKPLELSLETAKASLELAHDAASGERPDAKRIETYARTLARDLEKNGEEIREDRIGTVAERLAVKPETTPPVDALPTFADITNTLSYVERLYTTPETRRKIKTAGSLMVGLELVSGFGQYAMQEFFDRVIGDKDELNVYADLLHQWQQRKSTSNFDSKSFVGKVLGKTAGLWAPTAMNLVADQVTLQANKSLNNALEDVGNKINQRTTESLLLQKYAFIQDIPPSEVLNIIERGKLASIDLIASIRADAYPGMARMVSNLIPAWQINKLATAFGGTRLWWLYKGAEKQVKELLSARGHMYTEADAIDARISSLLSNLEIAQASGKSADVATQLQEAMREREALYSQDRMKKTSREGWEKIVHFVYNRAAPVVVTATEYLQARNKYISPIIAGAIVRDIELQDMDYSNPGQVLQLGMSQQPISRQLADAEIRSLFLSAVKAQQFNSLQYGTAGEASRLTSIYANNLIPDLQDIAQMEQLLGPWDMLDRPDGPREKQRVPVSSLPNLDISIQNLSVKGILRDVSFDIKQGEFVAIRAQKGEGKTTLLRAMLGLNQPEAGRVTYGGVDVDGIKKFGREALHAKFGYSPQSAGLIDTMTLKENLLLWNKDIPEEKVVTTMKDLGLEKLIPRLNETGNHFSGGEKRLLSMVRSLLTNPQILFLDEPTANLDLDSIDRLVATLQAMRKTHPETTIVTVTHDEDFAKHTDRTINLAELNKKPERTPELNDHQVLEAIAKP